MNLFPLPSKTILVLTSDNSRHGEMESLSAKSILKLDEFWSQHRSGIEQLPVSVETRDFRFSHRLLIFFQSQIYFLAVATSIHESPNVSEQYLDHVRKIKGTRISSMSEIGKLRHLTNLKE